MKYRIYGLNEVSGVGLREKCGEFRCRRDNVDIATRRLNIFNASLASRQYDSLLLVKINGDLDENVKEIRRGK